MAKRKVICGVQQVGIGVRSVEESWAWYKDVFGFDVKMFGDEGVAERMLPYTGGKPQPRYAILVLNLRGGGGFEVWEPRGRELNHIQFTPEFGDYGIFACKVKSRDVQAAYKEMRHKGVNVLTEPVKSPSGKEHFFVKDPWGNIFDIESDTYCFLNEDKNTGGNNGAVLGVSDMEKSIRFYGSIMDYDKVEYDVTGVFDDLKGVPGGEYKLRRVMLTRSKPIEGPLSEVMGTSHIELVQRISEQDVPAARKLYEGRLWGDPGFIHLCFDIRNMEEIRKAAEAFGHKFVCDGGRDFKMGEANGHFTYIEDPDGTLIEFVETFKIPILKKLVIYLTLENRDDSKPLPSWMLKCLRFMKSR
ncbi:MAG: VOC family protein [Bacteroidales bacterium]|nr:VOC family protein [Bacteroidales bacterium]